MILNSSETFAAQLLGKYEKALPKANTRDPSKFDKAALLLDQFLMAIVSANETETRVMLRFLTWRVITDTRSSYSPETLLRVMTATSDGGTKQRIVMIMQSIEKASRGEDCIWSSTQISKANNNNAVASFFHHFKETDIFRFVNTPSDQRRRIETIDREVSSLGPQSPIDIDGRGVVLIANSQTPVTVYLSKPPLQQSLPRVISCSVVVKPSIGRFKVDGRTTFLPDSERCDLSSSLLDGVYRRNHPVSLTLSGIGTAARLDVISEDYGQTWAIGAIVVIPPEL